MWLAVYDITMAGMSAALTVYLIMADRVGWAMFFAGMGAMLLGWGVVLAVQASLDRLEQGGRR